MATHPTVEIMPVSTYACGKDFSWILQVHICSQVLSEPLKPDGVLRFVHVEKNVLMLALRAIWEL
jgi:hypothetical protein